MFKKSCRSNLLTSLPEWPLDPPPVKIAIGVVTGDVWVWVWRSRVHGALQVLVIVAFLSPPRYRYNLHFACSSLLSQAPILAFLPKLTSHLSHLSMTLVVDKNRGALAVVLDEERPEVLHDHGDGHACVSAPPGWMTSA